MREPPVIATNDAVDVLRHGWQDAASIFAPDFPAIAELLQARIEIAVASAGLDETHLLDAVEDVELMATNAGSTSGHALARRLRRTVYEYLLALDAAPSAVGFPAVGPSAGPEGESPVGAGKVAGPGDRAITVRDRPIEVASAGTEVDPGDAGGAPAEAPSDDQLSDEPAPRRSWLGLRRRQFAGAAAGDDAPGTMSDGEPVQPPDADTIDVLSAGAEESAPAPLLVTIPVTNPVPAAESTPAEPHLDTSPPSPPAGGPAAAFHPAAREDEVAVNAMGAAADSYSGDDLAVTVPAAIAEEAAAAPPAAIAEAAQDGVPAVVPAQRVAEPGVSFVAPRAGFYIVEDAYPHSVSSSGGRSPLTMPAFDSNRPPVTPQPEFVTPSASTQSTPARDLEASPTGFEWVQPSHPGGSSSPPRADPAPPPGPSGAAAAGPATPAVGEPPSARSPADGGADANGQNGWRVRDLPPGSHPTPAIEEDPFDANPRFAELRRRIDERLHRRRFDEAAALLQELAQETGGRIVAELAMNAGDRCRSLGKSNAALNCYLAASRADPVYELPLSRLADICIDDQDSDLAVSYLERIARLYRFRGDDKAALRVYRRIATIAPYREDVLALLMNAQSTGRFES